MLLLFMLIARFIGAAMLVYYINIFLFWHLDYIVNSCLILPNSDLKNRVLTKQHIAKVSNIVEQNIDSIVWKINNVIFLYFLYCLTSHTTSTTGKSFTLYPPLTYVTGL